LGIRRAETGSICLTKSRQSIYNLNTNRMKYTIRTVASMTGLSQYTIRAWERRHHILSPDRTETNRRLYGDEDVFRLKLLKQNVDAGHSIGQASKLTNEELTRLGPSSSDTPVFPSDREVPTQFLNASIASLNQLDEEALRDSLVRGAAFLGAGAFIEHVILPLLSHVENRWVEQSITIAQEHMVTAVLRTNLEQLRTSLLTSPNARKLLVTTPKGQMHELGALIISVIAGLEAWQVTYLGPNLPANEIAGAAVKSGASAVALSLVFPVDDPDIPAELILLRQKLGNAFPILIGGRAAPGYLTTLRHLEFLACKDLNEFRSALDGIH
jgi:MerR family transcriptional regulator, light-induced transcriptional regulator